MDESYLASQKPLRFSWLLLRTKFVVVPQLVTVDPLNLRPLALWISHSTLQFQLIAILPAAYKLISVILAMMSLQELHNGLLHLIIESLRQTDLQHVGSRFSNFLKAQSSPEKISQLRI